MNVRLCLRFVVLIMFSAFDAMDLYLCLFKHSFSRGALAILFGLQLRIRGRELKKRIRGSLW